MGNICCSQEHTNIPIGENSVLISFEKYVKMPKESAAVVLVNRNAFWDTSPSYSGRIEIWQMLRLAAESDHETAQCILNSENITCPTGKLTDGCYDVTGNFYLIPDYCMGVRLPEETPVVSLEKSKSIETFEQTHPITVRLSTGIDITCQVSNGMKIIKLKESISKTQNVSVNQLKAILLGTELNNQKTIGESKITEKTILQVFVGIS